VPLPPDDPRPPYLQIADALRQAIRTGELSPGAQIPSTNELALRYGVARNTVRSAVRELTDEGLLVARHGSGVFVRSTLPEPLTTGSDSSRLDAVVQELTEVREEVRDLRHRMEHLETLLQRQDTADR
jgi:DNA-binding GntR family transcriptional regulator